MLALVVALVVGKRARWVVVASVKCVHDYDGSHSEVPNFPQRSLELTVAGAYFQSTVICKHTLVKLAVQWYCCNF